MSTASQAQFIRYWRLILSTGASGAQQGLDVSQQRIRFEVRAADVSTPNTLQARIYNLASSTANQLFATVANTPAASGTPQPTMKAYLEVGYQNTSKGLIFQGDVVQMRIGADDAKDSYLDVFAADGDTAYRATINESFSSGITDAQQMVAIAKAMAIPQATTNDGALTTGGILPRGKVMFGMARDYAQQVADKNNCRWSIQNGALTLIPNTGYIPGSTAFVLNSQTGMIGVPEQTEQGIFVRCYMNPLIKIGGLVRIDSADIAQSARNDTVINFSSRAGDLYYAASISGSGLYRVMVAEHVGDTRSNEWFTELTCLAVDEATQKVQGSPS